MKVDVRPQLPKPPRPLAGVPFSSARYEAEVRALYRDMDGVAAITAQKVQTPGELEALRKFVAQANELLAYREGTTFVSAAPSEFREAELCLA